jgi:hypothetical protein
MRGTGAERSVIIAFYHYSNFDCSRPRCARHAVPGRRRVEAFCSRCFAWAHGDRAPWLHPCNRGTKMVKAFAALANAFPI